MALAALRYEEAPRGETPEIHPHTELFSRSWHFAVIFALHFLGQVLIQVKDYFARPVAYYREGHAGLFARLADLDVSFGLHVLAIVLFVFGATWAVSLLHRLDRA